MPRALAVMIIAVVIVTAAAARPSLKLMGVTWRKSVLRVLIGEGAPMEHRAAVARAFRLWRAAMRYFAELYGYEYLRKLGFKVYLEGVNGSPGAYDVIVRFFDQPSGGAELGEVVLVVADNRYVIEAEIRLFLRERDGRLLKPVDVLNVALHEIGHILCIGHAAQRNTSNGPELMYHEYAPTSMVLMPSTLDVYGVAVVYGWLPLGKPRPPIHSSIQLPAEVPYRLTAYYAVNVVSEIGHVRGGGWYLENSTAVVEAEKLVEVGDVRYVFTSWRGDVEASSSLLELKVDRNYTMVAEWARQYRVVVETAYSEASPEDVWVDEGSEVAVSVREVVVDQGNWTRRVFDGWSGSLESRAPSLRVKVNAPLRLKAIWRKEYMVKVRFSSASGIPLVPEPSMLEVSGHVYNTTRLWLEPGRYRVAWALWRGVKVRALSELVVREPGEAEVRLAVWSPRVVVVDALSLPLPFVEVLLEGPLSINSVTGIDGSISGLMLAEGSYRLRVMLSGVVLAERRIEVSSDRELVVKVNLSPYLLSTLIMIAAIIIVVVRRMAQLEGGLD